MKKAVLVTGAAGFIGSHLVDCLRDASRDTCVQSLVHRLSGRTRETWACDLADPQATKRLLDRLRPAVIFHAAGRSWGSLDELMSANVLTTFHLLQAADDIVPRARIVLLGSAAEYGDVGPYAWSKRCQTLVAHRRMAIGQNIVFARLYNLIGPGLPDAFVVGTIARQISACEKGRRRYIRLGNLSSRRDFLDVRDAARAIALVSARGQAGHVYDVCSGTSHTIREVLNLLLRETSRSLHVQSTRLKESPNDIAFSAGNPCALRRLGWAPRLSLKESLRDTLQYYRDGPT